MLPTQRTSRRNLIPNSGAGMQPVGVGLGAVSCRLVCFQEDQLRGLALDQGSVAVGWWGMVAVLVASVFFFGAIVGGFK